jgi:hypothetical protein
VYHFENVIILAPWKKNENRCSTKMNQNSLTNEQSSFRMIQLDEVGDKLFLKDKNAIRKWLKEKGIGIYPRGKKYFVSEIEVDY